MPTTLAQKVHTLEQRLVFLEHKTGIHILPPQGLSIEHKQKILQETAGALRHIIKPNVVAWQRSIRSDRTL